MGMDMGEMLRNLLLWHFLFACNDGLWHRLRVWSAGEGAGEG